MSNKEKTEQPETPEVESPEVETQEEAPEQTEPQYVNVRVDHLASGTSYKLPKVDTRALQGFFRDFDDYRKGSMVQFPLKSGEQITLTPEVTAGCTIVVEQA